MPSQKKQKFLIVGGSGLLGQNLQHYLLQKGHEVSALSRGAAGVDFTDHAAAHLAIKNTAPDVIVNLAAFTNVDGCEKDIEKSYALNVQIVENIISAIKTTTCHFIQISTDMVYDSTTPSSEQNLHILNVYALTKRMAEMAIEASDLSYTVLRTNFFGRSLTPNRASFSDWLIQEFNKNSELNLFADVYFSPLHMTTLSTVIEMCALKKTQGIFNAGSKNGISKKDFAVKLAQALDIKNIKYKETYIKDMNLPAKRPLNMTMNSSKLEAALNFIVPTIEQEILKVKEEM